MAAGPRAVAGVQRPPAAAAAAIIAEIRATTAIAAPLAAANLAQMAMGVTNMAMVGHLGGKALAAAGLGAGLYFTTVVLAQGVLSAVAPLSAFAMGAGDRHAAARIAGKGLVLAALMSVPAIALLLSAPRLLAMIGYDPPLAREIGGYIGAVVWGTPGALGFAVLRSFLAAVARTRPVMAVLLLCVPLNAVLNVVLIWGHLGLPALGMRGAGCATSINQWLMFLGLAGYLSLTPGLASFRLVASAFARRAGEIGQILRLGLPIGGIVGLEIGVFVTTGVLMGLFGVDALGAHQLVLNCAGLTFMVPLGIGQAASVRVAVMLGGNAAIAAQRAAFIPLALGAAIMAAAALVLWTAPGLLVGIYVDSADPANRELTRIALRLFAIAALFQIFDGVQTIAAGALRGYKDTAVPLLLASLGYWGIGFCVGLALAFPLGWGPVGLWYGLAAGLMTVALMLSARLYFRARAALDLPA
jgi:MATE family multidrug resistance protein